MTGPAWPRQRYSIWVKKGSVPLGIKLHQTREAKGVYINGFSEGPVTASSPSHLQYLKVGDVLVSVDGKDVLHASLPTALAVLEAARRRDRLRDFITTKQEDRRNMIMIEFDRVVPNLSFQDVVL
ncbi:unnamed protein product, partial [Discosporangium mesarthrocarpum]